MRKQKLKFCNLFSGVLLGPLLSVAVAIDPSIIVTALLGTMVIFGSFSLSAIFAERGCWLYLGGILTTVLSSLTMLSLANLFFASHLLFKFQLYVGLLALCGFVLYDTQLIIEKRRHGNKDFVSHALDLFIDFFDIFKSLVFILCEKVSVTTKLVLIRFTSKFYLCCLP
jgi:FtsH-binding integral membrane protein